MSMGLVLLLVFALLPVVVAACFYISVVRTKALTNVSVFLLRTVLRLQNLISSNDDCAVEPCPGGIVLKGVVLPDKLLELATGSVIVQSVSIKRLHLLWATSSSPLTLCVTGIAISVLQRRTAPKVQPNARPVQRHAGKLKALEALLWDGQQNGGISGWRGRQLQLLRFMTALTLRNISVIIADAEFQYRQTGDPAPVLKLPDTSDVDAVSLTIRTVKVSPVTDPNSQSQAAAARRPSTGPSAGTEPSTTDGKRAVETGPPPAVQRRLYRWRNVSALFPRVQALSNWLDRLIANYQPIEACNASRVSVVGVSISLMSKTAAGLKHAASKAQQQASRQQTGPFRSSGLQRLRGRSANPGRSSALPARAPAQAVMEKSSAAASTAPEWDSVTVVLRQWSMQVDVFLGPQPKSSSHGKRPAARTSEPLAFHVQGFFGIRGQQRSAEDSTSGPRDVQMDPTGGPGSFSRRTGGPDVQASASARGLSRLAEPLLSGLRPSQAKQPSAGADAPGAAKPPAVGGSAHVCDTQLIIHVDVALKALVPELSPEAAVQLLRMVDRLLKYGKYSVYWSQRPSVSVTQSPTAWWQHAGRAVINDCREHFPLRNLRNLMARRAEYIRTYKELRSMQRGFLSVTYLPQYDMPEECRQSVRQPMAGAGGSNLAATSPVEHAAASSIGLMGHAAQGAKLSSSASAVGDQPGVARPHLQGRHPQMLPKQRVVYSRPKSHLKKLALLSDQLARLESQLPLGQIMCNRTFVALWHSSKLRDAKAKEQWLEAMGVITNFVDAIPAMDEEEEPDSSVTFGVAAAAATVDSSGGGSTARRKHRVPETTHISLGILCPRLGLKLINKHSQGTSPSAVLGDAVGIAEPPATLGPTKRPADVLAVMLEGISFFMPDVYRISLQAATVKASLLGGGGAHKHALIAPASRECTDQHGTKLDFSAASPSHGLPSAMAQGLLPGNSRLWADEGSIYPDTPLSLYLSRYKIRFAAVEVALSHPSLIVAVARFVDSMVQVKAAIRHTAAGMSATAQDWPSTDLHSLVMDSYMRNRVRLPSSMAVFMPKLQLFCPLVSARWMLAPAHTPSIGGISGQRSEALAVAVVSNLRVASRYVHTCYGSLVQSMSAQAHIEMYFQLQPRSERILSTSRSVIGAPQLDHFAKMWLHPDDVELAYPLQAPPAPQDAMQQQLQEPSLRRQGRAASRIMQGAMASGVIPSLLQASTLISEAGAAGQHRVPPNSYPFLPLLKIRSFSALALNQVPYEPAVPGTMTAHQTVGMHSAMAWFSPWHAMAISAAVDSLLMHPVLAYLRNLNYRDRDSAVNAEPSASPRAPTARSDNSPTAGQPSPQHTQEAGTCTAGGGSSISLLLDVPLFTLNCYAEMPRAFGVLDDLPWNLETMKSGRKLQLAAWVTKRLALTELTAGVDPVVRWGLRLAPLLTVDITNVRAGLRLTQSDSVMARLQMNGLQITDHQARLKKSFYAKVWLANSGQGSKGPASDTTSQLLGPLATRSAAVGAFARDRRRAALCLSPNLAPVAGKLGQTRQQWRRLLEVQLLHRATDFAMFLLSPTHRLAARQLMDGPQPQPLDYYRMLFQEHMKISLQRAASPGISATPSEPATLTTNSPSRSSVLEYAGPPLSRSVPAATRNTTWEHSRSNSALDSVAALFTRGIGVSATPHRKSASLVQMLGAVANQNLHRIVTLKQAAGLLTGYSSMADNGVPAPSRNGQRNSMSRISEDTLQASSSFVSSTGNGIRPQFSMNSNVVPAGTGSSANVARDQQLFGSNNPGHATTARGLGVSGSLSAADAPGVEHPLHSAFITAKEQSHAAAHSHSTGSTSSSVAYNSADAKLSFVQTFRHLGNVVQQQRLACVYNMPLPNPVIVVVMTQVAGDKQPTALHASCQHLTSCVGVHSVGAMLLMLVQVQHAMRSSVRDTKPVAEVTRSTSKNVAPSVAPRGLKATLDLHVLRMKVVMEEAPTRWRGPPSSSDQSPPVSEKDRVPGLTELTCIQLSQLSAELSSGSSSEGSAGQSVEVEIRDISILDLQGCIEHRNVLVAKSPPRTPAETASSTRRRANPGPDAADPTEEGAHSCRVNLVYRLSPVPGAPAVIRVSVHDPCVTWLRRYSNNMLYAVGVITEAYTSAARQGAAAAGEAATVAPPSVQPPGEQRAATSTAGAAAAQTAPVILVEAFNMKAVLPGGAAARHGPIRRAVHNEAISVEMRSIAVYIPGGASGMRGMELLDHVVRDEGVAWMTTAEEVDRLISSSLRLGDKHFPQVNQQAPPAGRSNVGSTGNEGGGQERRQPPAKSNSAGASSPSNRLQKHLQAAKATFIDPLKEILQEAGQKRTKQRGEVGLVLVDERPAHGPTGEFNRGYLDIEDDERRLPNTAAGHTTTTVLAANVRDAVDPHGPVAPEARTGALQQQHCEGSRNLSSQPAGRGAATSSSHAVKGSHSVSAMGDSGVYHDTIPMVLISVDGLSATSCKVVPYDDSSYKCRRSRPEHKELPRRHAPGWVLQQQRQWETVSKPAAMSEIHGAAREWTLPQDLCNVVLYDVERVPGKERARAVDAYDRQVDSALHLLAGTELQSMRQLIDPVKLKGVVFHHGQHNAVQVHLSALGAMVATLGPQPYERLMKVLTDNISEAFSCFSVGSACAARTVPRRTTFSPGIAFAPRPGQLPYFHLTVEWLEQLRVVLESDPAWWTSNKTPALGAEPCLQSCFTQCSLGLMMAHQTNDMFLAFNSQQLHIADVRISAHERTLDTPAVSAVYTANGGVPSADMTDEQMRRSSGDGPFCRMSGAAETICDEDEEDGGWTVEHVDGASTATPDGQYVQPVVDDQLAETFPGTSAVVTLLRSNIDLPADESAHLAGTPAASGDPTGSGECPRDGQHNCVRVSFAMLQDGTMANEIELCHTLVQWPYLTEMSLVSSIIAIFMPGWGCPPSGPEAQLRMAATPWLYFNLLLHNSQVYVPVLAPHLRHLAYGWRAAAAEASGADVQLSPEKLQQLFASMVEDAAAVSPTANAAAFDGDKFQRPSERRQSSLSRPLDPIQSTAQFGVRTTRTALSPLGDPVLSGNWATLSVRQMANLASYTEQQPRRLEQMGVVISMTALRIGYFAGGDGDSIMKVDLRNAAGFVRHSSAQVTNWILPIRSMVLEHRCSTPMVEESQALQRYILTARVMARQCLRVMRASKGSQKADDSSMQPQLQHLAEAAAAGQRAEKVSFTGGTITHDSDGLSVPGAGVNVDDAKSARSRAATAGVGLGTAQDILVEQATGRAAGLLELHKLPLPTSSASRVAVEKLLVRQAAVSKLTFEMDTAVVRASFSNIPLWHALMDDVGLAMTLMQHNNGIFSPAPALLRRTPLLPTQAPSEAAVEARETWNFRPRSTSMHANIKSLGLVLCDDKPKSYGAPDVLTAATEQVSFQYSVEKRYWDHLPEQLGCISLRLAAQFLNNSTGRWEHLLEPWPAELHLSDPINPVFKSSRTKYVFVSSSELMKLTFHPSCLLTLGDTLSFVRRLSDRHEIATDTAGRSHHALAAPVAEDPPSISEQMALSGSIMTRVPQRYLIQNHTGLMMSYWAPKAEGDVHPASGKRVLPSGCSEELQVTPAAKQVKIVGPGGVVLTRLQAQVIVLNFEGSWMPIPDVSVDVVGKYCYDLHSPTDDRHAPVVVDVALVGRTKILKIHSALYVQNGTSLRLCFRLHFPSVLLAGQVALGAGDVRLPGDQDIKLRVLKPGEGRYLPVVAALGGSLYLEARSPAQKGWCVYGASQHDVIRLFPNVTDMQSQSGFIASGLPTDIQKGLYIQSPLHFAVKVRVKTRTEYSYTTFHSMEVPGPGMFAKASRPLEASIKVCPTVVLTNSLPYHMEGYLISLHGAGKESDASSTSAAVAQQAAFKPLGVSAVSVPATSSGVSGGGTFTTAESRRLLKGIRRSDTLLDEIPETDQDRIISVFERALLPMLNQKAKNLWDARAKYLGNAAPNDKKKCFLLALLSYELRWTAKRNAKEMELLARTDMEPADRITWQELEAFLEWAKHNVRLVHVQPGETQRLYLDMQKQLVMCIKIPERKLVCTRPVEVNYGSSVVSNREVELPDFMRLDYIEEVGKGFYDIWDKMRSGNHSEAPKNFVKVVNQQFRETAAAVGDKVVNTVRGAFDVFSGPHTGKAVQPLSLAEVTPLERDSATYWQHNPDKVVRVQLLTQPGPWQDATIRGDGALSTALQSQNQAGHPEGQVAASVLTVANPVSDSGTMGVDAAVATMGFAAAGRPIEPRASADGEPSSPAAAVLKSSAAVGTAEVGITASNLRTPATGPGPFHHSSPFAMHLTQSTNGTEKRGADAFQAEPAANSGNASPRAIPAQSMATSPIDTARSDVPSPSLGLPPARSILGMLRSSVINRFQDTKGASPSKLGGPVCPTGTSTTPGPQMDGRVCLRLRYRPEAAPPQTPILPRITRRLQAAFDYNLIRTKEGENAVSTPSRPSRSSGEAPRSSSRDKLTSSALSAVRMHLHVLAATLTAPEHVRVQLIVGADATLMHGNSGQGTKASAGHGRLDGSADGAVVDVHGTRAWTRGSQLRRARADRQSLDDNALHRSGASEEAKSSRSFGEHPSVTGGRPQIMPSAASGARIPMVAELALSPYTPHVKSGSSSTAKAKQAPTALWAGTPLEASPGSVVVLHSGPVSPISVPGGTTPSRQACSTRRPEHGVDQMVLQEAGTERQAGSCDAAQANTRAGVALAGALPSGMDAPGAVVHKARGEAADAVRSASPLDATDVTLHRSEAIWSENAVYKHGSSVSTISGSDLPMRMLPADEDFQQCGDALKVGLTTEEPRQGRMRLPLVGDVIRSSVSDSPGTARSELEAGISSAPHPQSQAPAVMELPSAGDGAFGLLSPTALSEGYAQLELFHASVGSPVARGSKSSRRLATSFGSLSLRRLPSKSPRSAGSAGLSAGADDRVGRNTGCAGPGAPDDTLGGPSCTYRGDSLVGSGQPNAQTANDLPGSPFMAVAQAVRTSTSPKVSSRGGGADLPVINEVISASVAGADDSAAGGPTAYISEGPGGLHARRLTADDVIGNPFGLDGDEDRGSGEFGLPDTMLTDADMASASNRKSKSDKLLGERLYGWRFHERGLVRGIGKKGAKQPSYKAFPVRGGRMGSPMALAKSAMQVVPRLPGMARNVGEMFVDGGQQMIQGVPQVASFMADSIIAGGQGVKDKVVESTGQAMKIAKPKIKRSLMAIAWKATEAMRKRKQGSDEVTTYDEASKSSRGGKRRGEVERAPKVLLLSLHNSLATKDEEYVCRLSLYAAYWVDNRSGFNLLFKDLDAPAVIDNLPFLLWHPVQVPGNKADAAGFENSAGEPQCSTVGTGMPRVDKPSDSRLDRSSVHGLVPGRRGAQSQAAHKPALLNDQTRTRFRINHPHYSETGFCDAFTVATTNQKYSVDIKGEKGEATPQRFETIGSLRSSAQSGHAKLAPSPCLSGNDLSQTAAVVPKERFSGSAGHTFQAVDQNRALPSNLQLGATGGERPAPRQQQVQLDVSQPPAGDRVGQLQPRLAGQCKGSAGPREEQAPSGAGGEGDAVAVEGENQRVPPGSPNPTASDSLSPAASLGTDIQRDDMFRVPHMAQSIMVARKPLETVSEITPAGDDSEEGPSTTSFPSFAPLPVVPDRPRSGQVLGAGVLEAGASGDPVPQNAGPGVVEVSLYGEGASPSDDARVSSPTATGGRLSSASAISNGGGRRRLPRFSKGRSSHGMVQGPPGQDCQQEPSLTVPVRRLYQFAVEVWAAPNDTVFGRTKIITVKNKYLILNATGLAIEYKQKGTPDPDPYPMKDSGYGKGMRFSRRLQNNARAAWHWDNAYAEQELMIRPAGDEWEWSGSFKLPELEDYFGLRIRHRQCNDYVIIPVNISVGPAGSVLITLKSIGSVPPYMIINRCRDVVIHLKQADYNRRLFNTHDDWDEIKPGSNQIPFAWDEPRLRHVVKVVATAQRGAAPDQTSAMDVDLDAVDANCVIYVQSRSTRTLSLAAHLDARERAKFLTDNAKKVYVTVYADGPTRVLCFSEDRSGVAYLDDENSLLNLSYRLQRVAARLKDVDQKLVQQLGGSLDANRNAHQDLDLPGGGSQGAAGSGTSPEEARQLFATRFGSLAGAPRGAGIAPGRQGMLQLPVPPSSGTTTPPSSRMGVTGQGAQAGQQASFAFQRLPSIGHRVGSTYTMSVAPAAAHRYPSLPSSAAFQFNPLAQRVQHSRSPSNQQVYGTGVPKVVGSTDGRPMHSESALPIGDRVSQALGELPAFEGFVDLPIGGDLTVILRSVEGLSSSLDSNEKLVAVEAKMAVVSSTPGLDGRDSQRKVTASWTQAADAAATSADNAAIADTGDGSGDGSGGFGAAGFAPSSGNAGRFTLQDHMEVFRDIAASSELQIDFYIAKGTDQSHGSHAAFSKAVHPKAQPAAHSARNSEGHARATGSTTRMVSSGQFAGCVRIPLMSTIECDKVQVWRLPLERKRGSQLIRGYISLSFQWSVTNEGMLVREVATLERILDEKVELLAQLNPLPSSATNAFLRDPTAPAALANQDAAAASPAVVDMASDVNSLGLGAGDATAASVARPTPVRKTAKALAESYYVNLELSVLEISGLLPREGIRASIAASMYGRQTANMLSTAMLPRAVVSMACGGETRTAASGTNSVHPRFPKNSSVFQNVPLGAKVSLKVNDQVSGSYQKALAEAEIQISQIPGTDPVYAWLALRRCKHGSRSQQVLALLMVMEEEGDVDVQLLMRIKISKPQVHGVALAVTLDLAGVGLCAKTNLEELFNYTMQKIRTSLVQTRTEVQVSLAVQTIQLDNQMLEAKNPVVLSPADVSGSSSLAQARRRHKTRLAQHVGATNPVLRMGSQDPARQDPLLIFQVIYNQASSNRATVNSQGQEDSVGILAFKKVILELGPLDFSADQEFIEGLVAYLNGIPLKDFYQDKAWQAKIDAMQGGSMTPLGATEDLAALAQRDKSGSDALAWLVAKEAKELELLRGQSSMWFYLEEFYLSDVFINVTLALSSSFNAGGSMSSSTNASGREDDKQRSMVRGFLSRVSGSNGFQLINVTNVPIQLEYVELQNHLVNRVSLVNKLFRHYSWIAIAQARKVLGGAGPAIAAIPASLLWAGIALFDLGQDVAAKRVNPLVVPTRIGYVTFTLMGQVIGVLSRTMCAIMGLLPPRFSSDTVNLSDSETARRFGIKPQTSMDALYLSQRDVVLGFMSAAFGLVHDTAAGERWKGGLMAIGIPMGLLKATVGLGIRPAAGAVEATSKIFQGIGLMCLGKRGIQGKLVRRVQAPGLAVTDVVQAARASAAQAAMQGALIAAWQAALPAISSSLADDEVVDVVAARSTRVVLLTNRHLAYLYARRHAAATSSSSSSASSSTTSGAFTVTYRVKWVIPNGHIDNIRGLDRGYAVSVEYHKPVKLGRLSLKLPLHKGMRTATAEGYKDLIFRLNRHIGRVTSNGEFSSPIVTVVGDGGCDGTSGQELSIMGTCAGS